MLKTKYNLLTALPVVITEPD